MKTWKQAEGAPVAAPATLEDLFSGPEDEALRQELHAAYDEEQIAAGLAHLAEEPRSIITFRGEFCLWMGRTFRPDLLPRFHGPADSAAPPEPAEKHALRMRAEWARSLDRERGPQAGMGIPRNLWPARLERHGRDGEDVSGWLAAGERSFLLLGLPGRGKSHLAAAILVAIGQEYVVHRHRATNEDRTWMHARWLHWPSLLRAAREAVSLDRPNGSGPLLAVAMREDLIVLDDVAADAQKGWATQVLLDILAAREGASLPLLVTTNLNPPAIEAWEPRIASRLGRLRTVTLRGAERRRPARREARP